MMRIDGCVYMHAIAARLHIFNDQRLVFRTRKAAQPGARAKPTPRLASNAIADNWDAVRFQKTGRMPPIVVFT